MQKGKKNKGILVIVTSLLVVVSSLAFFSDRKIDVINNKFGSLAILSTLTTDDDYDNRAPGDKVTLDLTVENQGSLDADIRSTYIISVPEDQEDLYKVGDIELEVDGTLVSNKVNTEFKHITYDLDSSAIETSDLVLSLNSSILNGLQDKGLKLEVLTEARQRGASDWLELKKEEINFGDQGDFAAVPSNNLIRSNEFGIKRSALKFDEVDYTGYVITFFNKVDNYTVSMFIDKFLNASDTLHIYDINGVELTSEQVVTPGSYIQMEKDGKPLDRLAIVIKGDLDRDGSVLASDHAAIDNVHDCLFVGDRRSSTCELVDDLTFLSADIDSDGFITRNDVDFLRSYFDGSIREFPLIYPQKPILNNKPKFSIRFGDNSSVDVSEDIDTSK